MFKNQKSLTQSKSKTIITRSMCVISLIVFTDKDQRTRSAFYTNLVDMDGVVLIDVLQG